MECKHPNRKVFINTKPGHNFIIDCTTDCDCLYCVRKKPCARYQYYLDPENQDLYCNHHNCKGFRDWVTNTTIPPDDYDHRWSPEQEYRTNNK